MPIGFIRRLARQSYRTTYVVGSNSFPTLQDNWTTQATTTYDASLPADSPVAWGGTLTNLDRVLTATGSGFATLGALLTFVQKPETSNLGLHGNLGGVILKVTPTFTTGSTAALEVWTKKGATWTKRRRVPIAGLVRSGETIVVDLTGPVLDTDDVDAYWVTLAPDIGTETLTWLCLHVYGICPNDFRTPLCPPGTPPEECDGPECDVDMDTWLCDPVPGEPPAPPTDPFTLPPILVKVDNPTTYVKGSGSFAGKFFHTCPRPTLIVMLFGDLPGGGSVSVTVADAHGVTFVEGVTQTISSPGTMTWTVLTGFVAANSGSDPALPPASLTPTTDFYFTRQLAGSAFEVAGNLLDILMYFWTYNVGYQEVC